MMRLFLLTAVIAFSSSLHAETLSPSASPSLEQRVADLEAYVNNSARGADSTNASAASNISGPGPASNADDDLCGTGAFHDAARTRAFLRWSCSREECSFCLS